MDEFALVLSETLLHGAPSASWTHLALSIASMRNAAAENLEELAHRMACITLYTRFFDTALNCSLGGAESFPFHSVLRGMALACRAPTEPMFSEFQKARVISLEKLLPEQNWARQAPKATIDTLLHVTRTEYLRLVHFELHAKSLDEAMTEYEDKLNHTIQCCYNAFLKIAYPLQRAVPRLFRGSRFENRAKFDAYLKKASEEGVNRPLSFTPDVCAAMMHLNKGPEGGLRVLWIVDLMPGVPVNAVFLACFEAETDEVVVFGPHRVVLRAKSIRVRGDTLYVDASVQLSETKVENPEAPPHLTLAEPPKQIDWELLMACHDSPIVLEWLLSVYDDAAEAGPEAWLLADFVWSICKHAKEKIGPATAEAVLDVLDRRFSVANMLLKTISDVGCGDSSPFEFACEWLLSRRRGVVHWMVTPAIALKCDAVLVKIADAAGVDALWACIEELLGEKSDLSILDWEWFLFHSSAVSAEPWNGSRVRMVREGTAGKRKRKRHPSSQGHAS